MYTGSDPRIARARELLGTIQHAAMATVNGDGTPHNTPYFFVCSTDLRYLYWGSHAQSQHSLNIIRTGEVFVVLYDAFERGGLFIRATRAHMAEGEELKKAILEHNRRRAIHGREALPENYYHENSPQRMYVATTQQFWVNDVVRDPKGFIIQDFRREIHKHELLDFLPNSV